MLYFYSWIDGWLGSKERKLVSKERKCCIFVVGFGSGWGLGGRTCCVFIAGMAQATELGRRLAPRARPREGD